MKARSRSRAGSGGPSAALALAGSTLVAELGRRLLSPADPPAAPAQVDPAEHFTPEEIERGSRFARPQRALALARETAQLAVLGVALARSRRRGTRLQGPAGGAAMGASLALATTACGLPFGAVARRRAMAVGLVTQSWRGWMLDLAKAGTIEAALAAGTGSGVVALTRRYPDTWWLPIAGGAIGLSLALGGLAPVLLDPLFNRFDPLPAGETRSDVLELAAAAGSSVGEVFRVDASRRTTGVNAAVTGLGPTRRVVLFDTLLDGCSRDEVRVVVAHELSHVRHRDMLRGFGFAALVAPASALAVQRISRLRSPVRSGPDALPAMALAGAAVMGATAPFASGMSRAMERRADWYSLELSGAPDAFIAFQRRIAVQNVADLEPPRWFRRLLATHPPTLERIGVAQAFAAAAARATRPQALPGPAGRRTPAGS